MKKKIAAVVPIRDFPATSTCAFDYNVTDDNYTIGELVLINFRKINTLGLITGFKNNTEYKNLKNISKLFPLLSVNYDWLKTIIWFSEYYHYSVGSTLKYFFPKFGKKPNLTCKKLLRIKNKINSPNKFFNKIKLINGKSALIHANDLISIENYYVVLISQFYKKHQSVLIICPEQFACQRLKKIFANWPVLLLDASLTDKEWRENWLIAVTSSDFKIVLATHKGALCPVKNLGLIVVDQENALSLIQNERNPRFDCRLLAWQYAKNLNTPVVFTSLSPSIFTLSLPEVVYYKLKLNLRPNFKIINQNDENVATNNIFGPLCEQAIKKYLKLKEKIFIFSFFHQPKNLYCYYCGYENKVGSVACKNCQQTLTADKKSYLGLKNELDRLHLISDNADNLINNTQCQIFIGGIKHLPFIKKIGLTIIVDADAILNVANFYSNQRLRSIIDYLTQASKETMVITKIPGHHVFNLDFKKYLLQELAVNKKFNLYPYGDMAQIIVKKFNFNDLENFKKLLDDGIKIIGPLLDREQKRYYLLLKCHQRDGLKDVGKLLPKEWILNRYPKEFVM
jgi:primosomal protein N'